MPLFWPHLIHKLLPWRFGRTWICAGGWKCWSTVISDNNLTSQNPHSARPNWNLHWMRIECHLRDYFRLFADLINAISPECLIHIHFSRFLVGPTARPQPGETYAKHWAYFECNYNGDAQLVAISNDCHLYYPHHEAFRPLEAEEWEKRKWKR